MLFPKNFKLFSLTLYCCMFTQMSIAYKAFVTVPVADLLGEPMQNIIKNSDPARAYALLPLCGAKQNAHLSCPRIQQLLFNETVDVLEERGPEVKITLSHLFYITNSSKRPKTTYWMLKKNLQPLPKNAKQRSNIPDAIDFKSTTPFATTKKTITLLQPLYDPYTHQTFSAGTRFVVHQSDTQSNKQTIYVWAFDARNKTFFTLNVPQSHYIDSSNLTKQQRIDAFVTLIRSWAKDTGNNYIPYVWGGSSVVTYQHGTSFVQKKIINNLPATSYALSDDATTPKTGLDCTGLIVRAAQIVGIPYFFKNSTTIGALMRPLQPHESLHAGDIILVRGHVMIVADTKRNTLVEARGQDHGYGKVHEIPLKNVFKGMTTFDDLQTAHATQKRLIRFDSRGVERNTFATFSLFSLASVWDAHTPQ